MQSTKQKFSQHDLRRLMQEQKKKAVAAAAAVGKATRIESPLAKYNDLGQLTCVICQSVVRSEDVWKVHINAKQHKENVIKARELQEKTEQLKNAQQGKKRMAAAPIPEAVPEKKPKSILKNASAKPTIPPVDFAKPLPIPAQPMEVEASAAEGGEPEVAPDAALPEGFFDDPKKDAIARNLEYKNPVEEEWERWQKEIRDEATVSNEIIAEDQEESTAERQIVEIDEHMRNWERVLVMEKRKEERMQRRQRKQPQKVQVEAEEEVDSDPEEGEGNGTTDDLDEFGSWRTKGWNNK